jgi:hypothetical protein
MTQSNDDTEIQLHRVKWFWIGRSTIGGETYQWASGVANSQAQAQRYVLERVHDLKSACVSPTEPDCFSAGLLDRGTREFVKHTIDMFQLACRELHDDCPWLIPMPPELGVMYAVGFEPTFEEMALMRKRAGL